MTGSLKYFLYSEALCSDALRPSALCSDFLKSVRITKRKQLEDKKLLEAYHAGDKTADEIIEFIRSGAQKKE